MVQCFFIRRIWVLSEYKYWIAGLLSVIAFITLGIAMFFGIHRVGHQLFTGFHGVCQVSPSLSANVNVANAEHTPIVIMWSVSDMVLDGAIAGLLCYYLLKVRWPLPPDPDIG